MKRARRGSVCSRLTVTPRASTSKSPFKCDNTDSCYANPFPLSYPSLQSFALRDYEMRISLFFVAITARHLVLATNNPTRSLSSNETAQVLSTTSASQGHSGSDTRIHGVSSASGRSSLHQNMSSDTINDADQSNTSESTRLWTLSSHSTDSATKSSMQSSRSGLQDTGSKRTSSEEVSFTTKSTSLGAPILSSSSTSMPPNSCASITASQKSSHHRLSEPKSNSATTDTPAVVTPVPTAGSTSFSASPSRANLSSVEPGTDTISMSSTVSSSQELFSLAPSVTPSLNGTNIVVGSTTLEPGGLALTTETMSISLGPSGIIKIDGKTTLLRDFTSSIQVGTNSVTSTMKAVPSGVSTELITSGVQTNTWITTTKDSESTTVPAIWCPGCGGAVIIWGLKPPKDVLIGWKSSFPELPKFTFPCIFDCAPTTQKQIKEAEDVDDDDDKEDDDETPTSSNAPTTDTASPTSQSSTETCSAGTTTASSCRVGCSISHSTMDESTSTTTVCYTTTCEPTTGCDVESVTTTSISTSTEEACPLATGSMYDAAATYRSLGLELPPMLANPMQRIPASKLTIYITKSANATSAESATSTKESSATAASDLEPSSSTTEESTTSKLTPTNDSSSTIDFSNLATQTTALSETTPSAISSTSPTVTELAPVIGYALQCHSKEDFPDHDAIDPGFMHDSSEDVCETFSGKFIEADTDSEKFHLEREASSALYQYRIDWIDGCSSTRNQTPWKTAPDEDTLFCAGVFNKAFDECNNGGIGGYVEHGCARYTFTGGMKVVDD